MTEDNLLDKTNRINLLLDFYEPLLTEKQQAIVSSYYRDDFSLGEIASEMEVSRQAVYEHVKRAGQVLEEYEAKLKLLAKHDLRMKLLRQLEILMEQTDAGGRSEVEELFAKLQTIDYTAE